ncbi:MAG: hypothetical protein JNK23_09970 [Opitutaceae bacterium]|nr:hypothetical protein [Opitutaceae bacterium]
MKAIQLVSLALTLSGATLVSAQAPTEGGPRRGGPGGPGRGGPMPIVRALDADKNGEISAAEIANAAAVLRALDTDNNGSVSVAELHPGRPGRPTDATPPADGARRGRPGGGPRGDGSAHARPVNPVMLALDADQDGALSAAEITNASASLLALDANKDGKLTRDELRPLPPAPAN